MSLNRSSLNVNRIIEFSRNAFWVELNKIVAKAGSVSLAQGCDAWLRLMPSTCSFSPADASFELAAYLRQAIRHGKKPDVIYFSLIRKAILDFSLQSGVENIGFIEGCRKDLNQAVEMLRWAKDAEAVIYARQQALLSLAKADIEIGVAKAIADASPVNRAHPEINDGLIRYKDYLKSQCLLAGKYWTGNERIQIQQFLRYLKMLHPDRAVLVDSDFQADVAVIKSSIDACVNFAKINKAPLSGIALMQLTLANLCLERPAPKDDPENVAATIQALYWFEGAKNNGATLSEAGQHFVDEKSAALKSVIDTTYAKLERLVSAQAYRADISREKEMIFDGLHKIFLNALGNESKLYLIVKFKDALETVNYAVLSSHDKSAFRRFVENALSFIALLIPAIVRAHDSHKRFGTRRFWRPQSQRAIECVKKTTNALISLS